MSLLRQVGDMNLPEELRSAQWTSYDLEELKANQDIALKPYV